MAAHEPLPKVEVTTQTISSTHMIERLRENLADFVRNISRIQENLYQDVTCNLSN